MPADPGASFVVVAAELAFELFVVKLDLPAQPGETGEALSRGFVGEVGEPVVGRLILALGPFGDQPLLARRERRGLLPLVRRAHTQQTKARGDGLAVGPVTERQRLKRLGPKPRDQRPDLLGLAVRQRATLGPPALARRPRSHKDSLRREHSRVQRDREDILKLSVMQAPTRSVLSP